MSQLVPRQLSAQVFPYLREFLDLMVQMHVWIPPEEGGQPAYPGRPARLLPSLLRERDLEAGRVWTYLPSNVDEGYAEQFTGHEWLDHDLANQGFEGMRDAVVAHMQNCIRASAMAFDIFDPQLSTPPFEVPEGGVLFGDEIYLCVPQQRNSAENVRDALTWGGYWNYGIVTDVPMTNTTGTDQTITRNAMTTAVQLMQFAVFSAFDDTGCIIWEPIPETASAQTR